jgi:D-amino-acid dehydrogenase
VKLLVLGAGVIGVTTAYELLKDGHEVVVIDRQDQAGKETSFANASLIACGHALSWASPQAPLIMLRSFFNSDQSIQMRLHADPAFWRWSLKFLSECTTNNERINTRNKHALCVYSQQQLQRVVAETGIDYHQINRGLMYLHRDQKSLDEAATHIKILQDAGQHLEVINREKVIELDPGYADSKDSITGAIYCPTDESGDCHVFTQRMVDSCVELGGEFCFDTEIKSISIGDDEVSGVVTDNGERDADAIVVSLGPYSAAMVKSLGVNLDVYPVKGYSITLPINGASNPFEIGGVDVAHFLGYARIGDHIRFTSVAEFAGYDTSYKQATVDRILAKAKTLFPNAADYSQPGYWACLRPATPKGTPFIGQCRYKNLFLNTGHGHLGWTMACGSARIAADLIKGRKTEIDIPAMSMDKA